MPNTFDTNAPVLTNAGDTVANTYQRIDETGNVPSGDVILTAAELGHLPSITGKKALILTVADSPETQALPLDQLDLIAIHFASFGDGRGYSFATLLRRQGFKGELRAFGDVFKDVLFYLRRVGFDSYVLKAGKDIAEATPGLHDFAAGYQASTAEPASHYQIGQQA